MAEHKKETEQMSENQAARNPENKIEQIPNKAAAPTGHESGASDGLSEMAQAKSTAPSNQDGLSAPLPPSEAISQAIQGEAPSSGMTKSAANPDNSDQKANLTTQVVERRRAPGLAIALYCLLALSAAVALLGRGSQIVPEMARVVAPIAFASFFVLFAVYRFALIRARRYSPGKAFVQLGIGSLFLLMLAPGVWQPRPSQAPLEPVERMLSHSDPSVRALACDAFLLLPGDEAQKALPALKALDKDPHPAVRERARRAIERHRQTDRAAVPSPLPAAPPHP